MRIGKVIHEALSIGLLLTSRFHSVGYSQQEPKSSRDNPSRGVSVPWFIKLPSDCSFAVVNDP